MTAYVIADIDVHDSAGYDEYKALSPAIVSSFGGRYLVRGGSTEVLEGGWQPRRLVVLEFASTADAKRWHGSDEYAAAKRLRQRATTSNFVLVEGAE